MSPFGPDPQTFFANVYRGPAPWDIGAAQPALQALFAALPPEGPVLDAGCGTGDLAIALAERGLPTLGVDFVAAAITEAERRAAVQTRAVRQRLALRVGDVLRPADITPSAWGPPFGTVVDSGFFHLLDDPARDAFVTNLRRALAPRGRYYLLAFAVTFAGPNVPRAVTEDEVRRRFDSAAGWRLLHCAPAMFTSRIAPVPAVVACAQRRDFQA
ncbi:MAG: class I SAM-dependent methyltransferase [Burkholderiaceae bacterium]|jgi:SAM-dependent methyltransferase|nr:class I SAM-dependent methyltransferase [Burkholderiaceae bacterium]